MLPPAARRKPPVLPRVPGSEAASRPACALPAQNPGRARATAGATSAATRCSVWTEICRDVPVAARSGDSTVPRLPGGTPHSRPGAHPLESPKSSLERPRPPLSDPDPDGDQGTSPSRSARLCCSRALPAGPNPEPPTAQPRPRMERLRAPGPRGPPGRGRIGASALHPGVRHARGPGRSSRKGTRCPRHRRCRPPPERMAPVLRERIYGGITCLSTLLILVQHSDSDSTPSAAAD